MVRCWCVLAWNQAVTVDLVSKGKSTNLKRVRTATAARKISQVRLMKRAESLARQLCAINTAGAYHRRTEERGQGEAIARNLMEMSDLRDSYYHIIISEGKFQVLWL